MKRPGITPAKLLSEARSGYPGPAFLFYGPERYLLQLTLEELAGCLPEETRSFNYHSGEGSTSNAAVDFLGWAYSPPWGAPWRLVVVKEEELLSSGKGSRRRGDEEAYLDYLAEPAPRCCLVLVGGPMVETRSRLFRALEKYGQVVQFNPLTPGELRRWALEEASARGKVLQPDALGYLVAAHAGDLGSLAGSVTKACLFSGAEKEIGLAAAQEVVSASPQGSIFNLVDAVGERDTGRALVFLRRLLQSNEPPLRIAFMISRQIRLILQAKQLAAGGARTPDLARALEVPPFVADKLMAQAKGFAEVSLVEALERMLGVDKALKGSSRDPQGILEEGILFLCRPAG